MTNRCLQFFSIIEMNVKLPITMKKQPLLSDINESSFDPPKSDIPEQELDVEIDNVNEIVQEKVEPIETIVSLRKEKNVQNMNGSRLQSYHSNKGEIRQLKQNNDQKASIVNGLRLSVADKRREIKDISEQVDRDLNKILLKAAKTTNQVNIRDIFSAPINKEGGKIGEIADQLHNIRSQIKRVNTKVHKISAQMNDPLNLLNQERGQEMETKIKQIDHQIRKMEQEKQILQRQAGRAGKDVGEDNASRKIEIEKLKSVLAQTLAEQRQQKTQIYHIQRQDILLMEKAKFIQQREGLLSIKRIRPSNERDRSQLQEQIKGLIVQINNALEERNKAENEKKGSLKTLTGEVSAAESKNWDICNRLRDIDAFILQYYEKKTKKKEPVKVQKLQKSSDMKLQSTEVLNDMTYKIQKPKQTKQHKTTDRNLQKNNTQAILVEKKKSYDFFLSDKLIQNEISLSDQFLGNKYFLAKLTIKANQTYLLNISATYINYAKASIKGFEMGVKIEPPQTETLCLPLMHENLEVINLIHVGYNEFGFICYLQLITSEGKELKWGSLEKSIKNQQKNIRRYQYAFIKAKILPFEETYYISGLSLSTVYLGPK